MKYKIWGFVRILVEVEGPIAMAKKEDICAYGNEVPNEGSVEEKRTREEVISPGRYRDKAQ